MRPRQPIQYGEDRGYRAHLRRGEKACAACLAAHAASTRAWQATHPRPSRPPRPKIGRPVGSTSRRDEVMDEWEWLRNHVGFREFPAKVGMTYTAWERMFLRARAAGDVRAVRSGESGRWAA